MRELLREVGPRVQSEEDNWEYGIADLTKATARAKNFFPKIGHLSLLFLFKFLTLWLCWDDKP